jgi:hypothetical protein
MNKDERIKELEEIIERQAKKIFMLYSVRMLAKYNYQLSQDILSVCKDRDQALRKVEEMRKEIKILTNHIN